MNKLFFTNSNLIKMKYLVAFSIILSMFASTQSVQAQNSSSASKKVKPGTPIYSQLGSADFATKVDKNGNTTEMSAKFSVKLTASGGTVAKPKNGDFEVLFSEGANTMFSPIAGSTSVSFVMTPNADVRASSSATIQVTGKISTIGFRPGLYTAVLRFKNATGGTEQYTAGNSERVVFNPLTAKFGQVGMASLVSEAGTTGSTKSISAKFYMEVEASGGAIKFPKNTDFEIVFSAGTTSQSCPGLRLDRNLSVGSTGNDVVWLFNYLKSKGFVSGVSTTKFDAALQAGIVKYKKSKGISPADSTVGAMTRASLMADCGSNVIARPDPKIVSATSSSITVSPSSSADIQNGQRRSFTVLGKVDSANLSSGLYTAILMVKTPKGIEEYPARTFITVVGSSQSHTGTAIYTQDGQASIVKVSNTKGETTALTASFPLKVWASGGSIAKPQASNFRVVFVNASSTVTGMIGMPIVIPNENSIAASSSASVVVSATVSSDQLYAGTYIAKLIDIRSYAGPTEFVTPAISVMPQAQSTPATSTSMLSASVGVALRMVFGSIVSLFGY